jgi:hypothetical protein
VKNVRLPLAVILLLFLASCNSEEADLDEYNDAPPVTVIITDLPSPFSPGTVLYIGMMRDERWSIHDEDYYKAQGHAPVGVDRAAVLPLHSPTGIPFKVLGFGGKADMFILDNNKTKVPLYKTRQKIPFELNIANVSISFTEFEPVPQQGQED